MTTAPSRAVSLLSVSRLRLAYLAAASTSLLANLSAPASAASCTTTLATPTCIITFADVPPSDPLAVHSGVTSIDTLQFSGATPITIGANQFGSAAPAIFLNFENATVSAGTSLTLNDNNPLDLAQSLKWTINGSLDTGGTGGDSIGNTSVVTLNGSWGIAKTEGIGSLAGSGSANILTGQTLITGFGSSTFSGSIAGPGSIEKFGNGIWTLTGDNSFTGTTTVSGGTLQISNSGAIDQSSAVNISGGELTSVSVASYSINAPVTITSGRLTGNAIITGNVSSNGGLQPGNSSIPPGSSVVNPGQDMGSIVVHGNYSATGTNAYVGMFINLDAAAPAGGTPGTTHDFLNIDGNVAGTNQTVFAAASFLPSPTGIATTGNGIEVIHVVGTTSGNDFVQQTAPVAGAYQYLLKYAPAAKSYFLQSAIRDELVAQPAILSAGQALVRDCYHDDQRVPDSPKGATYGRAWLGYGRGSSSFGADTGVNSDVDFSCTTGGMDWRMGGGWFGGVSGGFGDTNGKVETASGEGKFTGTGRSAEVFASFTSSALFINLSAGYNAMDYTYSGHLQPTIIRGQTSGMLATAQTGVALDLDAVAVKLMGSVSYDGTNCSDACLGIAVTQDSGLIEAKGTVRFDGVADGGSVRPWAAVSFSDVLSDGINGVHKGVVSVLQDPNDQLVSVEGGLQAYIDQNFALYVDGGYHESLSVDVTGYKASMGLKMYW